MPAIERKITIARPGTYHYSWGDEVKTAEDLKEAVSYSPTIKLTLGHPSGGRTRRRDFLGYVKPKWNEDLQVVEGNAWFYSEHFDKIPEEIRRKIVNYEPWKISPGFTLDEESKDGTQKGTFFDHVAILRDEDNPVCPLDKCGVNVRLEAESMPKLYYEQETEVGEKVNTTAPEPEETVPEVSSELDTLRAEVTELKELILGLKPQPSEQKPEVEEKAPEEPVEQVVDVPKPEPVPELVIPAGVAPASGLVFNERGNLVIKHQPKESK